MKYLNILLLFLLFLTLIGSANAANEDINPDRYLLDDLAKYYHDTFGAEYIILKLDANKLKYGDYIQLKGFDYLFKYLHIDNEGYLYFRSEYGICNINQDNFNRLYTGYTLLLNY